MGVKVSYEYESKGFESENATNEFDPEASCKYYQAMHQGLTPVVTTFFEMQSECSTWQIFPKNRQKCLNAKMKLWKQLELNQEIFKQIVTTNNNL
ncbi:MAG: hypothetical protein Satyrvirus6_32 [Satyrvirus sp.]|uniref:Uncharacterized protein n=1 Tax=Satyrvirus sp. TaxID=2487771 RepID=A0A3G5ADF0_9VIRU|nr:MAG: hypothetical protein Satyrvirus6_32 [Satyrvirus sp.]